MPSSYSTNLKIELIATGEQSGTWGVTANNNMGTLIEEAICGVGSVAMTDANTTLSIANGVTSTARNVVLSVSGALTATRNLVVPSINKTYIVYNNTSGGQSIVVKTSSGTGITIPNGQKRMLFGDSTDFYDAISSVGNFYVNGTLSSTGAYSGTTGTFTGLLTSNSYLYSNTGTGAMARLGLQNTNRHWTVSNYGTSYSPNGRFAIADETAGSTWFTIDVGGLTTIAGALNYGGVTLTNAVTGTGSMVLSASPTFTGTVTGTVMNFSGADGAVQGRFSGTTSKLRMWGYYSGASTIDAAIIGEGAYFPLRLIGSTVYLNANGGTDVLALSVSGATLSQPLTYGGVTLSNSVTGTGSMVLSASPTFTGTLNAASISASGSITTGSISSGGIGYFVTPNSGTTGGVVIRQNSGGGSSILQFVNNAINTEWGNISATSAGLGTLSFSGGISIPYALTYGGVTLSNSVTGTGSMVLSASPTFTGTLSAATISASSSITGGSLNTGGAASIGGALTYGGVTLTAAVTGTGSMVLSASPTFTGTVTSPTLNVTSSYQLGGATFALSSGGYSILYDGSARQNIFMGGTGAPANYYRNTTHYFQSVGGSTSFLTLDASNATFGTAPMAIPTGSAPLAMARAWVNWTGGGTTINSSLNVSSIIRVAAGQYIVSFSTAAPNATYATVAQGGVQAGVFVTCSPDSTAQSLVYSSNTLSQTYQDTSPYSFVAYW